MISTAYCATVARILPTVPLTYTVQVQPTRLSDDTLCGSSNAGVLSRLYLVSQSIFLYSFICLYCAFTLSDLHIGPRKNPADRMLVC